MFIYSCNYASQPHSLSLSLSLYKYTRTNTITNLLKICIQHSLLHTQSLLGCWVHKKLSHFRAMMLHFLAPGCWYGIHLYPIHRANSPSAISASTASQHRATH